MQGRLDVCDNGVLTLTSQLRHSRVGKLFSVRVLRIALDFSQRLMAIL